MSKTAFTILVLANLTGFILVIVMNYLANALPLNGKTTGELSALYPNLFVPAGLSFSIWGLIYLLLTAFVVYQGAALFQGTGPGRTAVEQIHVWFLVSCLMNAGWIFAWHYQKTGLSLLVMLGLLGSLLMIYQRLQVGAAVPATGVRWLVHLPFSIYLGWISIATIANVTAYLVHVNWGGWGISPPVWTLLMLAAGLTLAFLMLFIRNDYAYVLVVAWAFFGIWLKRSSAPQPEPLVVWGALLGMILMGLAIAGKLLFFRK